MFRKIESHTTTNLSAQSTQQQSRPPIPNNNKPPIPNKQPQTTISHFLIKIANYSKNAWQPGGYDLPGPPIGLTNFRNVETSFFFIYAFPIYYCTEGEVSMLMQRGVTGFNFC